MRLIICFFVLCSCSSTAETNAVIIKRQHMQQGKLQLTYKFFAGQTTVVDSIIVPNSVVADTVLVQYNRSDPSTNDLLFNK